MAVELLNGGWQQIDGGPAFAHCKVYQRNVHDGHLTVIAGRREHGHDASAKTVLRQRASDHDALVGDSN